MSKAATKAYMEIRQRILSGEFAPGLHLKEEELADVIGVSRTPIRDALRNLAADLYVTSVPNHGTFVNDWTAGDIEEIFTLRGMLEGYAARRAAEQITPDQIATLHQCCDRIEEASSNPDNPDIEKFLAANRLFHQVILDAAGSERLSLMLSRLVEQPVVLRTATSYSGEELQRSNGHHQEITQAMEVGDGNWAEAVMVSHIHSAMQTYRRTFRQQSAAE